jgi:hypothetical protein
MEVVVRKIMYKNEAIEFECTKEETGVSLTLTQMMALHARLTNIINKELPVPTVKDAVSSTVKGGLNKAPTTPRPEPPSPEPQAPAKPTPIGSGFNQDQITRMKETKARLKIKANDELNPFIKEWSINQKQTWQELNGNNIDDFIKFLDTNA